MLSDNNPSNFFDLNRYPPTIASPGHNAEVIIGDLDGNIIKLLHILIREGVIALSEQDYDRLNVIYHRASLDKQDIDEFKGIISNIKKIIPTPSLVLIGDDLADRGKNDYFMLKAYEKLHELGVDYTILMSNHGFEFLYQYAHGLDKPNVTLYRGRNEHFGRSLHGLQASIAAGLVDIDEVDAIVRRDYLDRIKWLALRSEGRALYTHTAITPEKIIGLTDLFGGEHTRDLSAMVDRLNDTLTALLTSQVRDEDNVIEEIASMHDSRLVRRFLNDRYEDVSEHCIESELSFAGAFDQMPELNIHGHVGEGAETPDLSEYVGWQYVNLDTGVGKYNISNEYIAEGEYRVATIVEAPEIVASEKSNEKNASYSSERLFAASQYREEEERPLPGVDSKLKSKK